MHAHWSQRLAMRKKKTLVSKEALDAMLRDDAGSDGEGTAKKVPCINYLIK